MSLVRLIPQQFATARHVVGMLVVPALTVTLALTPGRLPLRPEDGLHVGEALVVDLLDGDCHGSALRVQSWSP